MKNKSYLLILILMPLLLMSCRGWKTDKAPVHPNPNFDWQAKFTAQAYTEDVPADTTAWGRESVYSNNPTRDDYSKMDTPYYSGKVGNTYLRNVPVKVDKEFLLQGQDKYNVYCSMCHGLNGAGNGTVVQKGYYLASNLHETRYVKNRYPDGKLYDVISNGYNNMWGYKKQISEKRPLGHCSLY